MEPVKCYEPRQCRFQKVVMRKAVQDANGYYLCTLLTSTYKDKTCPWWKEKDESANRNSRKLSHTK